MNTDDPVIRQYAHPHLATEILHAVGKPKPETEELSPYDEFHIGGRRATKHLVDKLHIETGMNVLDIGCGLGGAARYVAETTGAYVTGIDLTPDYIHSAVALSDATGLGDNTQFIVENALDLTFADHSFNAAYTMHASMNIEDKAAFYREIHRVLKPHGRFALYDVMSGKGNLHYPVPWAANAEASFLATADAARTLLQKAGFEILEAENRSAFAIKSLRKLQETKAWAGPRLIMGDDCVTKITNLLRNIEEGHCEVWQVVCTT